MIMKIEESETRLFETKTKTNFSLTFQMVKPEEFLMRNHYELTDRLERRIRNKCLKVVKDQMTDTETPRQAFNKLRNELDIKESLEAGDSAYAKPRRKMSANNKELEADILEMFRDSESGLTNGLDNELNLINHNDNSPGLKKDENGLTQQRERIYSGSQPGGFRPGRGFLGDDDRISDVDVDLEHAQETEFGKNGVDGVLNVTEFDNTSDPGREYSEISFDDSNDGNRYHLPYGRKKRSNSLLDTAALSDVEMMNKSIFGSPGKGEFDLMSNLITDVMTTEGYVSKKE